MSDETSDETSLQRLLRWRLARAEAEAPPAPRAARLLERARPWWEAWPERFRAQVERLGAIQVAYGHAMAEPRRGGAGHPVPTLIVRAGDELEAVLRVLYLSVRNGRLRLRFTLQAIPASAEESFEVTFVSETSARPVLAANATRSVDTEYRLDAELPPELATSWGALKVTDRMPFRCILRPATNGG